MAGSRGANPSGAARQAGATTLTQGSENFGYSAQRLRRIAKLQFGIINPNELVRRRRLLMSSSLFVVVSLVWFLLAVLWLSPLLGCWLVLAAATALLLPVFRTTYILYDDCRFICRSVSA